MSSTFGRLSQERHTSTSVLWVASQIFLGVNVLNFSSVSSMTKMSSSTIMQVAVSSVNWGLKVKPSFVKNSMDFLRFLTGRLTKILVDTFSPHLGSHRVCPTIEQDARRSTSWIARSCPITSWLLQGFTLCAQTRLLLSKFRRESGPEVFGFKHLTNLNLGFPACRVGAALHPLDCFLLRFYFPEPEPCHQLFRLGKRAVNDSPLCS